MLIFLTMKIFFATFIFAITLSTVQAQIDTLDEKTLAEVLISAHKFSERKRNITQKTDVITAKAIANSNSQTTSDLLSSTGNIFIQKSQQGGGSPILRGFEANQVLLVIDGVRMNNAIYRSGHLQNIITVDQNMLERVEILYGPGSTLFGSDALGGVIFFRTKSPLLSQSNKIRNTGNFFSRFSSVNNEKSIHFNLSTGGKKFAWLQSFTYSNFDDLKMGSNFSTKYPNFGKRIYYIDNFNGVDSIVKNPNDRLQLFSGYKQWDIIQKFLWKQSEKISHLLNFQASGSSSIPRYDRLQDVRNGRLRFAEWYYGPQKRFFGSHEMNVASSGFFNQIRTNINFQHIEESRQQREYRRYDRLDSRLEKLDIWGFIFDARRKADRYELTLGADAQLNDLHSTATRTNTITNTVSKLDSRYPDGKNKMNYFGVFAQHLLKLANGKLIVNNGLRLQTIFLKSNIVDNSFYNFPFTSIKQNNVAVTGNLGIVYLPDDDFRVVAGVSSGFRNPNIDDLSKTFEPTTSLLRIVIPNPNIDPEFSYSFDLGFTQLINKKIKFDFTSFYTIFKNAISLSPFRLNGQDSMIYNGIVTAVFSNQNNASAYIYGFNSNITVEIAKQISIFSTVTYTYGRLKTALGKQIPQDHIPPVYGKSSIRYESSKFDSEFFILYNAWKRIKNYNLDGEDNPQYATVDGTPSWLILNWKNNYKVTQKTNLQFAIENILDRNYRPFASGISAPGRNFVLTLRTNF